MIAKIVFEKEIHMYRGEITLKSLKNHSLNVFKALKASENVLNFFYHDEDGDKISISCQADLQILREAQTGSSIKKLFIEIQESEFEDLNPEMDSLISEHSQTEETQEILIKPKTKATQVMSRFKEEAMIEKQAKLFFEEMTRNAARKIAEEEDSLVKEEVSEFIENLVEECSQKLVKEEERVIKVEECLKNLKNKPRKSVAVQRIELFKHKNESEDLINRVVEEKIRKLMPDLLKKTVKAVEMKMSIEGKTCVCQKKSKVVRSLSCRR